MRHSIVTLISLSCLPLWASECRSEVDFQGQVVTIVAGEVEMLHLYNSSSGISAWNATHTTNTYQCGDILHVFGHSEPSASPGATIVATRINTEGHKPLPETIPIDAGELQNAFANDQRAVSILGTVVAAVRDDIDSQWNWVTLDSPEGRFVIATPENIHSLAFLKALTDGEIECRGVRCAPNRWRSFIGNYLILFGDNGIVVRQKPPQDPFAVPELSNRRIPHRQRTDGVVLGVGARTVFLSTKRHGFLAVRTTAESTRPSCGASVTVSGFASFGHNGLQLTEAVVRVNQEDPRPLPQAKTITPDQLFSNISGNDLSNPEYYGKIVQINGEVRDIIRGHHEETLLKIDFGGRPILIDPSATSNLHEIVPGCRISVSGVCVAEFDTSPTLAFPKFNGFIIHPRTDTDLTITQMPSWWTPSRLLIIIGVLLSSLIVFFVWNIMLRRISERRAKELAAEGLKVASAELKVEERTRLAVELHDALSQTLTGIALQIETAMDVDLKRQGNGRKFLETAMQMLTSCRQELRLCIWDLHSRTFQEKNMKEAILRTISPHVNKTDVRIRFNALRQDFSESSMHAILKIIRELVVNATRHGKATQIRIAGECHAHKTRFSVIDNGQGFDPKMAPGPAQGHFGLQGIKERLAELNGSMKVMSAIGHGTKVVVNLTEPNEEQTE